MTEQKPAPPGSIAYDRVGRPLVGITTTESLPEIAGKEVEAAPDGN